MSSLFSRERPATDDPAGLLILCHGRGTDERDLLPLADALDPRRQLHLVTPQGPLQRPGWPGHYWYVVPRVGYPDPKTFAADYRESEASHNIDPNDVLRAAAWLATTLAAS